MTTINEIAAMAGVAKSTVSRYLNGGSISPETKQKIENIIQKTGYQPNVFAQSLKAKKTGLIGVVIPRLNSQATTETLLGIDRAAKHHKQRLLIFNADQDQAQELEGLQMFLNQKTDALILIATRLTQAHYDLLAAAEVPALIIGQEAKEGVFSISYDDYQAGLAIAGLAEKKGFKKVLYVGVSPEDIAVGQLRAAGVLDGLAQAGIAYDVLETTFNLLDAYQLGMEKVDFKAYDQVIAATDNIALGLLKAAQEQGIDIPQDTCLSGFGGYSMADAVHPSLTSVAYPYRQAGELAIEKAQLEALGGDHIVLPVQLLERASTQKLEG